MNLTQLIAGTHRTLYRLTGGAFGGRMAGGPVLLLTTTGRKTGKVRTWPLRYFADGPDLVVVASNAGLPRPPGWCFNLRSHPQATVEIRRRKLRVRAEEAPPAQRERLWNLIVA